MNSRLPTIETPETGLAGLDPATVVRRALLASATELATAVAELTPADRRRQRALDRWFAGFAAQLRSHHELIDTYVVPALAARGVLDDQALDTLASDHCWIDELLSDLGDALGVLSFGLGAASWWLGKVADLSATLRDVLRLQLAREESLLTPLVASVLEPDERELVHAETVRTVATGPVRFSLAWLYAHLTPDERTAVDAHTSAADRLLGRTARAAYQRTAVAALR